MIWRRSFQQGVCSTSRASSNPLNEPHPLGSGLLPPGEPHSLGSTPSPALPTLPQAASGSQGSALHRRAWFLGDGSTP